MNDSVLPDKLQYAVFTVISNADCQQKWNEFLEEWDETVSIGIDQFCIEAQNEGTDTGGGDAGGAVVSDGKAYGIISASSATGEIPVICTKLSSASISTWIEENAYHAKK
ncbi:mast cell protease 8-like [Tubulanus polymorphus]|uniref:mast cell protease 8-like n=1 Tax=Tubulanus polymorphus TaxID=672921 RepID=UPI003DA2B7A6